MSSLVPPRDACDGWHERLPFCLTGTASLNLLKKHAACAGDCKARLFGLEQLRDSVTRSKQQLASLPRRDAVTTLSNIARAGNAPCKLVYALIPTVAERGAVTNVDAVVAVRAALTAQLQDFEVVEAALECLSRLSKDPASRGAIDSSVLAALVGVQVGYAHEASIAAKVCLCLAAVAGAGGDIAGLALRSGILDATVTHSLNSHRNSNQVAMAACLALEAVIRSAGTQALIRAASCQLPEHLADRILQEATVDPLVAGAAASVFTVYLEAVDAALVGAGSRRPGPSAAAPAEEPAAGALTKQQQQVAAERALQLLELALTGRRVLQNLCNGAISNPSRGASGRHVARFIKALAKERPAAPALRDLALACVPTLGVFLGLDMSQVPSASGSSGWGAESGGNSQSAQAPAGGKPAARASMSAIGDALSDNLPVEALEALAAITAAAPADRAARAAAAALVKGGVVERAVEIACNVEHLTAGHPRVAAVIHVLFALTVGDGCPAEALIRTRKVSGGLQLMCVVLINDASKQPQGGAASARGGGSAFTAPPPNTNGLTLSIVDKAKAIVVTVWHRRSVSDFRAFVSAPGGASAGGGSQAGPCRPSTAGQQGKAGSPARSASFRLSRTPASAALGSAQRAAGAGAGAGGPGGEQVRSRSRPPSSWDNPGGGGSLRPSSSGGPRMLYMRSQSMRGTSLTGLPSPEDQKQGLSEGSPDRGLRRAPSSTGGAGAAGSSPPKASASSFGGFGRRAAPGRSVSMISPAAAAAAVRMGSFRLTDSGASDREAEGTPPQGVPDYKKALREVVAGGGLPTSPGKAGVTAVTAIARMQHSAALRRSLTSSTGGDASASQAGAAASAFLAGIKGKGAAGELLRRSLTGGSSDARRSETGSEVDHTAAAGVSRARFASSDDDPDWPPPKRPTVTTIAERNEPNAAGGDFSDDQGGPAPHPPAEPSPPGLPRRGSAPRAVTSFFGSPVQALGPAPPRSLSPNVRLVPTAPAGRPPTSGRLSSSRGGSSVSMQRPSGRMSMSGASDGGSLAEAWGSTAGGGSGAAGGGSSGPRISAGRRLSSVRSASGRRAINYAGSVDDADGGRSDASADDTAISSPQAAGASQAASKPVRVPSFRGGASAGGSGTGSESGSLPRDSVSFQSRSPLVARGAISAPHKAAPPPSPPPSPGPRGFFRRRSSGPSPAVDTIAEAPQANPPPGSSRGGVKAKSFYFGPPSDDASDVPKPRHQTSAYVLGDRESAAASRADLQRSISEQRRWGLGGALPALARLFGLEGGAGRKGAAT